MRLARNIPPATVAAVLAVIALPATALASSPPTIESESVSEVTQTDATLNATINPQGLYTAYQFQIDTNDTYAFTRPACPLAVPGYAECQAIIVGEPLPVGLVEPPPSSVPAGSGPQSVSIDLAAVGATLQADTTYHFRLLASNDGQIVEGPEGTFTTASIATPSPIGATVPTIANATQSNSVWREGGKLAQINRRTTKPPVGTTFSFSLNEQAVVSFTFDEQVSGPSVGKRCRAKTRQSATSRSCVRTTRAGTFAVTGHAGTNKVIFQGRISRSRRLKPGRYTLFITATNSLRTSAPQKLSFMIVK